MPLDTSFENAPAELIVRAALEEGAALVSSFGASSAVLLHMAAREDRDAPVLVVDTGMLFTETLRYVEQLSDHLGLTNLQVVRPEREALFGGDPDGILHLADPKACCALRKRAPLDAALAPFPAWITGRQRHQTRARGGMAVVEAQDGKTKYNPLAAWGPGEASAYMDRHALPRHPLSAAGYASIGCAPCTTPVGAGEDPRAGRWRDIGIEACGIHQGDRT